MKRILCALAALLFVGAAHAQEREIHPALFAVRDADSTIYLFGTMHVRQPGAAWGGPEAVAALNASSEIWTELEMSPQSDAAAVQEISQAGLDRQRMLSSYLDDTQRGRLNAVLDKLGASPVMFEPMRPWYASLMLSVLPLMRAGYDPNAGVDRQIDALGDAAGKRMRWFETAQQQYTFFANLPEAVQVQMLMQSVDEASASAATLEPLERAWERGNLRTLEKLAIGDTEREHPEVYEALIAGRNRAWTETLAQEMAGSGVDFVAVGAAHLVGDDGLVAMLRARGFRVQRLN